RQVSAYLAPRIARIVTAHDIPMLLHEEHSGSRRMHRYVVHTVSNLRGRIRYVLREESLVDRFPRLASVVGSERARGRDGDEDPLGIARIENDSVQAHSTGARLPVGSRAVSAQAGQLLPVLAAVGRAE